MIQAVIFDMDGVIIDSHAIALSLLCEAAAQYGVRLTEQQIQSWGSLSSRQFWTKVKNDYQLETDIDILRTSYDTEREIAKYAEIGLIDGILPVIQTCKSLSIGLALATSASRKRMQAVLELFDLEPFFDVVLCDEDVSKSKPDPEIFLKAARTLGVEPETCLVIEDSQNGIIAAKEANMTTVGYNGSPYTSEHLEPDYLVSDFTQLDIRKITTSILS